jgi:hypothetical protein
MGGKRTLDVPLMPSNIAQPTSESVFLSEAYKNLWARETSILGGCFTAVAAIYMASLTLVGFANYDALNPWLVWIAILASGASNILLFKARNAKFARPVLVVAFAISVTMSCLVVGSLTYMLW